MRSFSLIVLCLIPWLHGPELHAQLIPWTGDPSALDISGSFHDGTQWITGTPPTSSQTAYFDDRNGISGFSVPHEVHFAGANATVFEVLVGSGDYVLSLDGQTLAATELNLGLFDEDLSASLTASDGLLRLDGLYAGPQQGTGSYMVEISGATTIAEPTDLSGNGLVEWGGGQSAIIRIADGATVRRPQGSTDTISLKTSYFIFETSNSLFEITGLGTSVTGVDSVDSIRASGPVPSTSVFRVADQALLSSQTATAGAGFVIESGAQVDISQDFSVFNQNQGRLEVLSGAELNVGGILRVTGQGAFTASGGATVSVGNQLFVTSGGHGQIVNGASLSTGLLLAQGDATIEIDGPNTSVIASKQLNIGRWSEGDSLDRLYLTGGAFLQTAAADSGSESSGVIGSTAGDRGEMRVSGIGTRWAQDGVLGVGFNGDGELLVEGGGAVNAASIAIGRFLTGTGVVTVEGATSELVASSSVYVGGNESGAAGSGELRLVGGGVVQAGPTGTITVWSNGNVSGNGSLLGDVIINGGSVAPGNSTGLVSVGGDFSVEPSGSVTIEIGGTSGSTYDQIDVTGDSTIAGKIEFQFVNGFSPRAGDRFQFLRSNGVRDISSATSTVANLLPDFDFEIIDDGTGFELVALNDGVNQQARTILRRESFEAAPGGTYQLIGAFDDGSLDFFDRYAVPDTDNAARDDFSGFDGGFGVIGQDHDGGGGSKTTTIILEDIDVSGRDTLYLSGLFGALNSEPAFDNYEMADGDGIEILASFDNGPQQLIGAFRPNGTASDLYQDTNLDGIGDGSRLTTSLSEFIFQFAADGNQLDLFIELTSTSSFEPLAVDNLQVYALADRLLNGDFNGDGVVNLGDYPVWRDSLGSTSNLAADANGNMVVDQADYVIWKANFGMTSNLSAAPSQVFAAVPEPAMLHLASFAVCLATLLLSLRRGLYRQP